MPHRTPEGRRVRVAGIPEQVLVSGGSGILETNLTYEFEDDVRIIGTDIQIECYLSDPALNADGNANIISSINRANQKLNELTMCGGWTAVLYYGDLGRKSRMIMFPEGYGVDVDEGEGITQYFWTQMVSSAPASFGLYCRGYLFYVERG